MSLDLLLPVLGGLVAGVLFALVISRFYLRARGRDAAALLKDAEEKALASLQTAAQEREQAKAAAILEGKMEVLRHREEAERELTRRREESDRADRRAEERERDLGRRSEQIGQQEKSVAGRVQSVEQKETALKNREGQIEGMIQEQHQRLERIAGLTTEDARRELLKKVEDESRAQAAALGREIREQAKKEAEKDAKKIIALATQRLAAEHV